MKFVEAGSRGRSEERPPWALDTRELAEGMPREEWDAKQDKIDERLKNDVSWKIRNRV